MNSVAMLVEERYAQIDALDLTLLKKKLTNAREGKGWSIEYADCMEVAYKRYLKMMLKYPDEKISPSVDVDAFWHAHILDTQRYMEDCQSIFGYFLHHYPYAGMNGDEDVWREAAARMHVIYEREFGEAVPNGAAFCWAAKPEAKTEAAFCWAAKPEAKAEAAFCWAAKPVAKAEAAFCWAAKPEAKSEAAFCWAAKPEAKSKAAFCWAAKPAVKAEAAFCWAAKPAVKAEAAFCWAAKPEAKSEAAFCWAAKPAVKSEAAFCWAAKPAAAPEAAFREAAPAI